MTRLDDEARALLNRYASAQAPSEHRCARTLERLSARVAADEPLRPELEHAAPQAAAGLGTGTKLLIVLAITTAAVVPLALGQRTEEAEPSPAPAARLVQPEPPSISQEPVETKPPAPSTLPDDHPSIEPLADERADESAEPSVRPKPKRPKTPDEPPRASLAEELALVDAAMRALQGGEHTRAVTLLRRHAREFPLGVLEAERELALAEALCAQGKTEAARRKARAFIRTHPRSPLRERAQLVCTNGERKPSSSSP